jgi:xylulokinase
MRCAIGIDVGTSSIKGLLVDADSGLVLARAESAHAFQTPHPGWAETDPEVWWQGTLQVMSALREQNQAAFASVCRIGVAGQMHGLVVLNATEQVIRPCIMWNDQRSAPQCEELERRHGLPQLLQWTGNRVFAGFTLPKLLWMKAHEPEHFASIHQVLLPKDYLVYRLTGVFSTDVSDASGTSLLDVSRRNWSARMITATGISQEWLPPVHESADIIGEIREDLCAQWGWKSSVAVIAGAGDQAAQALGSGLRKEGDVALTIGTSGVIFAVTPSFQADAKGCLHAFCHAVRDHWHLMGVMLSAAGSLQWWYDCQKETQPDVSLKKLLEEAAAVPQGAEGVGFLPYLTGERNPFPRTDLTGGFYGLRPNHRRGHFTRAVLEGVAANFALIWDLMQQAGVRAASIRVSGGGSKSDLWLQIIADMLQVPLVRTPDSEGAALGGALLAASTLHAGEIPTCPSRAEKTFNPQQPRPTVYAQRMDELLRLNR